MKKDCECGYCKNEVDEYFCVSCFYNFNKCQSFHEYDGGTLCPKCHPLNWVLEIKPAPIPLGFFDKKGRFCSIRNKQRKFLKNLRDISGVNEELMGSAET